MSSLTERLAALDTCVLSDALDALGVTGVAEGLNRLATTRKVAGRVMTVKLEEARGRTAPRHLCTAAVDAAAPGDVIVVEHHARADCAGWGGILSKAAALKGLSGTIIDGMARDIDEAEQFGYPVFGKGGIPRTARGRIIETEYATPITVDGITVLQSLRADAVLHATGDPAAPEALAVRDQVRAAFLDDDPAWLETCWPRYEQVLERAIAHLS